MLLAHLSDLHIRDSGDVKWLERQLDRIAARVPDHLAITGDVLDRWNPRLLAEILDAIEQRGLLDPARLTIIHGNHDFASSGGHPRRRADVWRLIGRFWDPPPLIHRRRRAFHAQIAARAAGVAPRAPLVKTLGNGVRLAVIDSVPAPWRPVRIAGGRLIVQHGLGCVGGVQSRWLAQQAGATPLVTLMHHYPLPIQPFEWTVTRAEWPWLARAPLFRGVQVPMHLPDADRERFWRAAADARTKLVICGHVHRARLEHHKGIAVGLNGQSGAAWAGRVIAYYTIKAEGVTVATEEVT